LCPGRLGACGKIEILASNGKLAMRELLAVVSSERTLLCVGHVVYPFAFCD
jgi:hypothetical protein